MGILILLFIKHCDEADSQMGLSIQLTDICSKPGVSADVRMQTKKGGVD